MPRRKKESNEESPIKGEATNNEVLKVEDSNGQDLPQVSEPVISNEIKSDSNTTVRIPAGKTVKIKTGVVVTDVRRLFVTNSNMAENGLVCSCYFDVSEKEVVLPITNISIHERIIQGGTILGVLL